MWAGLLSSFLVYLFSKKYERMTLQESFENIPDPRRAEGLRTTLPQMLCMVTLSAMAGYTGYRPVETFCKANQEALVSELGLKHGIPSHVTFRAVMMGLDSGLLASAFHGWSAGFGPIRKEAVSGDGKALCSTVSNVHSPGQDFQAVVSLFSQQKGLVYKLGEYRNAQKGKGETELVKVLISELKGAGVLVTLDALHTKKDFGVHTRIEKPLLGTSQAESA